MDSLQLLHTFREVAARGSFSRAAVRLRVSRPTVSKHVAELERRFDVRLLHRSTRAVSLTDAGQVLLDRSEPLVEMAAMAGAELREHASRPRGRLRIAVSHGLDFTGLPDILSKFMTDCPDVHLGLHVTHRQDDLAQDGCDLALRVGRLRDENLIVRRLARVDWVVCASPQYWARSRMPAHPEELHRHELLGLSSGQGPIELPFQENGKACRLQLQSRMQADEASLLLPMALQGFGAVSLPVAIVRPHLENGALVSVLEDFMPRDIWFHAAYAQRRHHSAALRSLLGCLESGLALRAMASEPANPAALP
ncbi:LysR family transcriptional regulator [Variovorax sp. J22P168]|uniref:LysR family transcriptional regulator n=1 Tax=Variovorax jilinensis TaxID=3053513 RepID=UPI0025769CA4|nr:LysR family transcriptional regulator [Variovorax sp. J22P168]MDM0012598.1 LysR family transcriptional regulator [Variovorax sp. J22P168]